MDTLADTSSGNTCRVFCVRLGHERCAQDSTNPEYAEKRDGHVTCSPHPSGGGCHLAVEVASLLTPSERTRCQNEADWHSAHAPSEGAHWSVATAFHAGEELEGDLRGSVSASMVGAARRSRVDGQRAENWISQAVPILTTAWPSLWTRSAEGGDQGLGPLSSNPQSPTLSPPHVEQNCVALKQFLCSSVATTQTISGYTLPCSYLMVAGSSVVGHARLLPCSLPGCPARYVAATYVVVDARFRKKGWGQLLMRMVEAVAAVDLKADYVVLWTRAAAGFYTKLG
uniref:N-acetyltransferase domain-containing protein n=1 Tax=Neospora caninum (strain Liverpool) TaxID=572307 RepID=A0A0F7UK26_NEOCL|nr:TPA: hypothetical protein BN1204_061315 [Neospora caninum Liverpool]